MKSRIGKLSGLQRKLGKLKTSLQTSDLDVIEQSKILRKIIHYRNLLNDQEQFIMGLVIQEKAIAAGAKLALRTPSLKIQEQNSGMVIATSPMLSSTNLEEESTSVTSLPGSTVIPAELKSKADPWILSPKESGSPPTSIPVNGIQDWMNSQNKPSCEDLPSKEWIQSTPLEDPFQPFLKKKKYNTIYNGRFCFYYPGNVFKDQFPDKETCFYNIIQGEDFEYCPYCAKFGYKAIQGYESYDSDGCLNTPGSYNDC